MLVGRLGNEYKLRSGGQRGSTYVGYEEGRDRERVFTLNERSGGDKEKAYKEVERQRGDRKRGWEGCGGTKRDLW